MSGEVEFECTVEEELENLLDEVAKEKGIIEYEVKKTVGAVKGDCYIGIITNIDIIGKNEKGGNETLHLVVKRASRSDALRSEFPLTAAFRREIYMYTTVFPLFQRFEMEKRLEPSSFLPKFYKGRMGYKKEIVILENLKADNYRLYERRLPMDDNHVSLALNGYGRLHALSFGVRAQKPDEFRKIVGTIDDLAVTLYKENLFKSIVHRCNKVLETLDPVAEEKVFKVFQAFVNRLEPYLDEVRKSVDDYSVILHGDCWTNNMMFKYEDNVNPTRPTKICFIDFQLCSMGAPVLDLVYFLYSCGSKQIIDEISYYKQLYYKSLSTYLQKLGSDPEKMFPYSVLQDQWKRFAGFGLLLAVINIHAMLTEENEAVDFKDSAEFGGVSSAYNYEIRNVKEYNNRIKHILCHFVENNLI